MSTGGLASVHRSVQDGVQSASSFAPNDITSLSSPMDSAKTKTHSPARTASTSEVASSSRSSPKGASIQRSDKDKKHDRERSASKDNDKARDKERETRLPACEACRTRKVKCDALLPACTPCQKSGRECFGRDKIPNVSRGLVYELQQKVKDLESRLALASSGGAANGHAAAQEGDGSDSASASASGSRSSRVGRPPAKRTKRGRNGHPNLENDEESADREDESSSSDTGSSSPEPTDPSPNDFIQQTSTILESLSSDLTGSAHRQHQPTSNRPTTQTLDNDEASALAALTKHHRDRAKSPSRLKRRSSSNASRYRDEAASYFSSTSRFKDASAPFPFKSRSRPGRIGTISAYDRTFFDRLIARYLTYMNTALPVINEVRLWELASVVYQDDERSRLTSLSATPYDTMPPPPIPPSPGMDRMTLSKHRYVILMALAIALASLGRSHNFSPELRRLGHQYWAEAQALFPVLYRFGDIDKLRATLLQLQYALLVPTAGSVWELSGAAIRLVTELNLHVDREYDSAANAPFSQETIDLRRRLFWTTYCLDRSLAVALARPPGLSDAWIHVQLPSLLSDPDLLRADREGGSVNHDNARIDPQKQLFRSHVNLRRVQSEILCRLHSVNPRDYSLDNDGVSLSQPAPTRPSLALVMEVGPPTPNIEWQSRMMEKLVEWRSEYDRIRLSPPTMDRPQSDGVSSTATPFITHDWIDLNHNLTISLLFRPSPNNPRPDSHGLQQAFMASGRAMKIYKAMHRSSTINFPWLATHHLFISGLTHLNALEKLTRTGFSCPSPVVEVVFNVQSCASTLEALTSRDDGYGTRIRDTFDAAASAVLRSVLDPGSMRQSSSLGGASLDASASDMTSVEDFIRGSGSLQGRPGEQNRPTSMAEGSGLRRTSHHDMIQAAQHPTWLSDSTWSSINALDAAPPPGSTIFVAAPPRAARFGTPGHSLVPTLSERTTQSVQNMQAPTPMSALQPPTTSRSFGMHSSYSSSFSPASMSFAGNSGATGDPFSINPSSDGATFEVGSRAQKDAPSSSGEEAGSAERAAASTFGFHNWLLQPYEGGADSSLAGMPNGSFNLGAAGAMLFGTNSPSAYAGDPFQTMYAADPGRGNTGQAPYLAPSPAHTTKGVSGAGSTDASTLIDFLSMLPATAGSSTVSTSVSPAKAAQPNSNGSPHAKA